MAWYTVAGWLIGLLGIVATLYAYRKTRDYRRLTYELSATPELLPIRPEIRDEIEITYKGRTVTDLEGVTVTLRSSGNKSVQIPESSEYEDPVTIEFGTGAEIIGVPRIVGAEPESLSPTIRVDSLGRVIVERLLLNPGQGISVFTLLSGDSGRVKVSAHIRDVEFKQSLAPELIKDLDNVIGGLVLIPGMRIPFVGPRMVLRIIDVLRRML